MINKSTLRTGVIAIVAIAVAKALTNKVPALTRFKGAV